MSLLLLPRPVLAVLLVAALGASGCLGTQEEPGDAGPAAEDAAGAAGGNGGDPAPTDTRMGPTAVNGTGDRPHMHDYWAGKERVTLFEGEIDPSQVDPLGWTFYRMYAERQPMVGGAEWRLPDGAIVFEGTGQLDLTATWSDPRVTSLAVSYRTPEGPEYGPFQEMASGKTLSIPVTPAMTDMPHMSTSRWGFAFAAGAAPGLAMAPFQLKVDVVKMRDVDLFPAHPDLFEGQREKVLHDQEHAHQEVSYAQRAPNVVTTGEFGEKFVTLASLVPMETVWMRVEVDILEATAMPGEVADIRFFYHGADTTVIGHPTVLPIEGSLAEKRLVYSFPVTMEQTDTPYGKESQWELFVEPATKFTGQEAEPTMGGMTEVSIKYRVKVIAYAYEPDMPQSKMEGEE